MNMKKWIIVAVACFALVFSAYGGQNKNSPAANPHKVYRVGMNTEFAPFESQTSEDNVEGFDVGLMNAMAKTGNFKVEFKHQPRGNLFLSFGNGDIDIVISGVTITDERKQPIDFSDPCFETTQVVLVPKGKKVASSDDLKSMAKVGIVTSRMGDFSVSKLLGSSDPKISRFETVPLIIKELESEGLDSMVSGSAVIANHVKNNPTRGLDFVTLLDFSVENYGIAVRKGDEAAVKMLNGALKKVRGNGKYDKIYAEYFAREKAGAGKAEKIK